MIPKFQHAADWVSWLCRSFREPEREPTEWPPPSRLIQSRPQPKSPTPALLRNLEARRNQENR